MKLKFVICILAVICVFAMSSCVKVDEKVITGDVKDNEAPVYEIEVEIPEDTPEEPEPVEEPLPETRPEEDAATAMGAEIVTEKGEYYDSANSFLYSLLDKDYLTLSSFTGGQVKGYEFLDGVDIIDFELYPVRFTSEKLSALESEGIYPSFEAGYIANLLVKSSDSDAFHEGDNYYFLGFAEGNPMGYELSCFVPCEKAEMYAFTDSDSDITVNFIREFVSLYGDKLAAGRNYPDSFDFSDSSHLVTHLMAENGYGFPPYSLDSINEFITRCFDGAKTLGYEEVSSEEWLYPVYSDISADENKLYGCSYAHGGYTVVHTVTGVEKDGEDVTYEVEVFADYSCFAPAYKLRMNFAIREGEMPMLMMVSVNDITGADSVAISL